MSKYVNSQAENKFKNQDECYEKFVDDNYTEEEKELRLPAVGWFLINCYTYITI